MELTALTSALDCTDVSDDVPVRLAAVRRANRGAGVRGGTNVLVGIPRQGFHLDSCDLLAGRKTLTRSVGGSCTPERDFATFAEWVEQCCFDTSMLVSGLFDLDNLNAADALRRGRVLVGRAVVEVAPR
jgi:Zn-dependent alcohol dehydrogenase